MSVFTHLSLHSLSLSEFFMLSDFSSLIQSLSSVSWTRGARPRGNLLYGQTWLETPDPVRSPKLSNHGRVQYSGGGPPGKRTYCTVSHISLSSPHLRSARARAQGGGRGLSQIHSGQSFLSPSKGSTVESVFCLGDLAARRRSIPTHSGPCGGQHSGLAVVLP